MGIFAINRLMNRQELAYSCAGLQDKLKDTVLIDWWVNTAAIITCCGYNHNRQKSVWHIAGK